ncbi:hypothetical protein SteCoe_26313 [Stentor coeruleus]|uniref:Uncharacterized protein n=1 Tax=Stentor coeruleus TaxID=5963 RepID=A0A1R2BD67_9CILI|nr:hypothetical protein SteCoe_26313 [Stentor coeruleus]
MEDLSFSLVLQIISGRQCNLPIIPTYIILDNKPISFASIKDDKLHIAHAQIKNLKDLFCKILNDCIYRTKLFLIEPILCYVITKKDRYRLKEKDIKDQIDQNTIKHIQYVQISRPHSEDYEICYILRLEYTKSYYASHFHKLIGHEKQLFFDSRIFEYTTDIANMIMSIIENHLKKRIIILEIEFLEDIDRRIWISHVREVKVVEPILCMHYIVKTPDDLKSIPVKIPSVSKFITLSKGQHIIQHKNQAKPPIDYTFVKGHIRNKKSNIELDLSIKIPEEIASEAPGESFTRNLFRTLSIKRGSIKSSTPRPRASSRPDSHKIQEIRDEVARKMGIKSKSKPKGIIGLLSMEMQKKVRRSMSDSNIVEEEKKTKLRRGNPKSRLVLKEGTPSRIKSSSPRYLMSK